ncbi:Coiled-coil and C2 domain-containing protein 1B [Phlyctochytrium bullatum]|nr:Coiled-coil and C2 domain-containing protein 1B [Phlyctochytrium bullatum]
MEFDLNVDVTISPDEEQELLAELEAIKASMGHPAPAAPAPKAAAKPAAPASGKVSAQKAEPKVEVKPIAGEDDIEAVIQSISELGITSAEDDIQVEFTDADMNDPLLLSELKLIAGNDFVEDHHEDSSGNESATSAVPSPLEADSTASLEASDSQEADTNVLQQQIKLEKQKALQRKRNGDKAGALEALKRVKVLEARLSTVDKGVAQPDSPQKSEPLPPLKISADGLVSTESNEGLSSSELTPQPRQVVEDELPAPDVASRMAEYKKSALAAKRSGNLALAREHLSVAKQLQAALEHHELHGKFPAGFVYPSPPTESPEATPTSASKPATEMPAKISAPTPVEVANVQPQTRSAPSNLPASNPGDKAATVAFIKKSLESQIAQCSTIAALYLKAGKKDKALEFHKLKKSMQTDLEAIDPFVLTGGIPTFAFNVVRYEMEQVNNDIGLDELEVNVVKAFDLISSSTQVSSSEFECYVAFDIGWPTEEAKAAEAKGQTGIAPKGHSPRKASVKLDSLLTKCEIHEVFPLADPQNSRKMSGGKLELRIRLRVPLTKQDISVKEEKWVTVIMGSNTTASAIVQPSQVAPVPAASVPSAAAVPTQPAPKKDDLKAKENEPSRSRAATAEPGKQRADPRPEISTPKAQATEKGESGGQEDVEELKESFLNPANLASNLVLEKEYAALTAEIAGLQSAKRPVPEELNDRKMGYELRMNMLVTLVQIGKLSMEDYIKSVKDSIAANKKMALRFKNLGIQALSLQAMKRVKIMTEEVAEVEQAIANGEL